MKIEKELSRHPLEYLSLLSIQLVGVWGAFLFRHEPKWQFSAVICMAISYVIWGGIHHRRRRDYTVKIFFEYVAFAIFAIILLGLLIFRP